ncbi:alpha/beta-Hydrolases superfamily protein [Wolffia australiana]
MEESSSMGKGITDNSSITALLLKLLALIPTFHYLVASLLVLVVFLYNFLEIHLLGDIFRGFRGDKVHLTYNSASEIYLDIVSKCQSLHGRYLATPWLSSPHFQTTFLNFFGNPPSFSYRRHMFSASDGGTIALDWVLASDVKRSSFDPNKFISKDDTTPIAVMVPGLTSDSSSPYMKHLVHKLAMRGWHVVVSNHRGLGGVSITSDRFYNSGWTEDIRKVINHLHREYPMTVLYAVGSSIGANILVKYLGEEGENTPLAGAASICSPWDLVVCDRFISRKIVQRFYNKALTIGLKGYAKLHKPIMSRLGNWEGIKRSNSVRDFDNHATCLVGNYETVDTYYRCCSSVNFVGNVSIPLLCISSLDDPVCTREAIPWDECRANKNIVLATTAHGGHLGFFQGLRARSLWWVCAVDEFLGVLHSSPYVQEKKKIYTDGLHTTLESSIDKSPYVNVMEDGMVATVANDDVDSHDGDDVEGEPGQGQDPLTEQCTEGEIASPTPVSASQPEEKSTRQLTRRNTWTTWLLLYTALVSTWPLIGPALVMVFKKKLKMARPWLRR